MPAIILRYSKAGEAFGYLTYPALGYYPLAIVVSGPVIDFSVASNSMYVAIVSAFV